VSLTRVSPALFQVSNNITSVTVGGSANTISLTFDSNGVITGASNNALSVANTLITGNIVSSQIASVNGSVITANTIANSAFQTGSVEQYLNSQNYSTGMRNRLINGGFDFWQRATSGSVGYVTDRWYMENSGTITRTTDVPSGNVGFAYSANIAVSAATSYGVIKQRIESTNTKDLPGQYVTLSFWAKTTQGDPTLYAHLYYGDGVDTYNSVTNCGSATFSTNSSWRKYSVTYGPLPTQVNRGFQVYFFSADAVTSPIYYITGVQLEKGSQATPFEFRQYGTELALCQRYYCKSYQQSVAPATSTTLGVTGVIASTASLLVGGFNTWPVTMRTTPTVTIYSQIGTSGKLSAPGAVDTGTSVTSETPSEKGAVGINSSGGFTIGSWYYGHFVATAEL